MNKFPIRLVLHNIRSAGNVGAIFRTADACGVELVYTSGYTPYPRTNHDARPPHIAASNTRAIAKTALGAELTLLHQHFETLDEVLIDLHHNHFNIIALEQAENSIDIYNYVVSSPIALVLGNEVDGVEDSILQACDTIIELPMIGRKESLNVSVAAGIALYQLRFGAK